MCPRPSTQHFLCSALPSALPCPLPRRVLLASKAFSKATLGVQGSTLTEDLAPPLRFPRAGLGALNCPAYFTCPSAEWLQYLQAQPHTCLCLRKGSYSLGAADSLTVLLLPGLPEH